jgi:hypothetical protein
VSIPKKIKIASCKALADSLLQICVTLLQRKMFLFLANMTLLSQEKEKKGKKARGERRKLSTISTQRDKEKRKKI